jgi:hypothetical protein
MPAMFSPISYISTSIQQSAEDPLHLSYEEMDDEEEEDEDIADDRSDSSWTNGKIFFLHFEVCGFCGRLAFLPRCGGIRIQS